MRQLNLWPSGCTLSPNMRRGVHVHFISCINYFLRLGAIYSPSETVTSMEVFRFILIIPRFLYKLSSVFYKSFRISFHYDIQYIPSTRRSCTLISLIQSIYFARRCYQTRHFWKPHERLRSQACSAISCKRTVWTLEAPWGSSFLPSRKRRFVVDLWAERKL